MNQELRQRLRGDTLAPVFPPDPIANLQFAVLLEPPDAAGHAPVEEYGLFGAARVGEDLRPVRHESVPVPGGEGGQAVGLRVSLVLEEHREVIFCYVP